MKGNYLRITDTVQFSFLGKDWSKVKDDYEGAFKPPVPGATHPSGMGQVSGDSANGTQASGLLVRIAATHSGIITRNNGFYLPDKMKKGAPTFIDDYGKPILLHHKDHEDNIGRVKVSNYVDTSGGVIEKYDGLRVKNAAGKEVATFNKAMIQDFISGALPFGSQVDVVRSIFRDAVLDESGYEGLGHIQIVADITDPGAIQKLLDGRYLTGSVGATTNRAVCSICRSDWTKTGPCDHKPGGIYDDAKCFIIAGDLAYDEYSFVNVPADRHSKVLQLHYNGIQDSIEVLNDFGRIYEVQLEFPQYDSDSKEETGMAKDAKKTEVENTEANLEIQDSATPTPDADTNTEGVQDQATDQSTQVEETQVDEQKVESLNDFLARVIGAETLSVEDEAALYDAMVEEILDEALVSVSDEEKDWEKISEEMEAYAQGLEGEDKELQVEDQAGEVEDAEHGETDKPGGSNAGKYKTKGPFCGPAGGAPKGTYPVNTLKRAKAALAYARHAPRPEGIRNCVCKHYSDLPSCKKKDEFLSKEQRDSLPKSAFCGPNRTIPVTNELHYRAAMALLDRYKGEADISDIRKAVERKGRANDWKLADSKPVAKKDEDGVQDNMDHSRMLRMVLTVLDEDEYYSKEPVLNDDEKKMLATIIKRMASLVGKDSFVGALQSEGISHDEKALLDEIAKNEEAIGDLRERLSASQKEYHLLFEDMQNLQDSLVQEKVGSRKVKEAHLQTLLTLKDSEVKEHDFTELSDSDIDSKLKDATENVDMTKITDKLGDGMSRMPEGSVEDPSGVQDNVNQKSKVTVDNLQRIEANYIQLRLSRGQAAAEAYLTDMKRKGFLPQDSEN